MPSSKQDSDFSSHMENFIEEIKPTITSEALDNAINWISSNLNPDDVFDNDDLDEWAESNGYTKEKE